MPSTGLRAIVRWVWRFESKAGPARLWPARGAEAERSHLLELCALYGVAEPAADATHFFEDFGNFRLKWERHSEFTT